MPYGLPGPPKPQRHYAPRNLGAPSLRFGQDQQGRGWRGFARGLTSGLQDAAEGFNEGRERKALAEALDLADKGDPSRLKTRYPKAYQIWQKARAEQSAANFEISQKAGKYWSDVVGTANTSKDPEAVLKMGINRILTDFKGSGDGGRHIGGGVLLGAMNAMGISPKDIDPNDPNALASAMAGKIDAFKKIDPDKKRKYYRKDPKTGAVDTFEGTLPEAQQRNIANLMGIGQGGWSMVQPGEVDKDKTAYKPRTLYADDGREVKVYSAQEEQKYTKQGFRPVREIDLPTLYKSGVGSVQPRNKAEYDSYVDRGFGIVKPEKGMKLKVGPDGEVEFATGVSGTGLEASKKTTQEFQEKLTKADNAIQRLENVKTLYDPAFTEYGTRLGMGWNKILEKAGSDPLKDLPPEQRAEAEKKREQYYQWKQAASQNINLYIKEITGAQMSVQEADRLMQDMPNPGTAWYNGDSASQFQAKLDKVLNDAKYAKMRYRYLLKNGLVTTGEIQAKGKDQSFWDNKMGGTKLREMPDFVQRKAAELEQKHKDDPNVKEKVVQELREQFGVY